MKDEKLITRIEELKTMTAAELIQAYDRVHEMNRDKKTYGIGELSGQYEEACYEEMLRRMEN